MVATGALPLVLTVLLAGVAQAFPEPILWVNGVKHLLLAAARLAPLLWLPWAVWAARQGAWPGAIVAALLALVGGGLPPIDDADGPGWDRLRERAGLVEDVPALEAALATFDADVLVTIEEAWR
ncbi:MAG: hypothetical protein IPO67_31780 [Deltaproteobacteria bacterium]|nr:hypothetical protein [Deltaproteobacteria bacterium]